MAGCLVHRGPDDAGFYFDDAGPAKAGFGFRRLSIIDLSGGHQPMRLGRKVIAFNGEIYNFRELRAECQARGRAFQTRSDTEVILHLFDEFGPACLDKLEGMFAFAIWDEEARELFLARDPLGIKPLYYFSDGKTLAFASEMKALVRSGEVPLDWDPAAVMDYCSFRFVPGPRTVLRSVQKVPPGHFLRAKGGGSFTEQYWKLRPGAPPRSLGDAAEQLFDLLDRSVGSQMIADVPLGAFLSGGVDSSLIAALMARRAPGQVQTFSIGFERGTGVDESAHARAVARHLGTEHHELRLTERDLPRAEEILARMNEPVADPTVLPTAILSEFARRRVKVALTGEGGDELFAGYNRYKAAYFSERIRRLPAWLRAPASAAFRRAGRGESFRAIPETSSANWFALHRDFSPALLAGLFADGLPWRSYLTEKTEELNGFGDGLNGVLELERRTSLVDRLLMKVDMASMGQSLEARPPYLDRSVVEFAAGLPPEFKIRRFKGKYVLRKAAEKLLPRGICWRRKHGFIVPLARWAQAGSGQWLRAALDGSALDSLGFFNKIAIQKRAEKIYNNRIADDIVLLWPVVVLSVWNQSLKKESAAESPR